MKLNYLRKFLNEQNRTATLISAFALALSVFAIIFCCFVLFAKTDDQVFNENINKTVEIRVSMDGENWGYGTGCFIDRNGTILTNKHMVYSEANASNYEKVQVRLPTEDDFIDAEIKKISENDDLATISIARENTPYFELANKISDGQEIYTIGNPSGFGLSFAKGNVSSKLRNVQYNDKNILAMQTSLVINEGNSGGPVFDKAGKLVGLVSFRLKDSSGNVIQGVSFAVPATQIQTFLTTK